MSEQMDEELDMEHLGGKREQLVGFDRRRTELVGAEEIVGFDRRRSELVGFDRRRTELIGEEGIRRIMVNGDDDNDDLGSAYKSSFNRSTELPVTRPGEGYGFVGRWHGKRLPPAARKMRRAIMTMARQGVEIPASQVDAFIRAARPRNPREAQALKGKLLARIADLGGKVRGEIVSGMGDFLSSATNFLGKTVGKGIEFGVRTATGIVTVPFKAAKKTFFPSSKKAAPGIARRAVSAVEPTETRTYAQRIARHRADVRRRKRDLQQRLELAEAKKSLAQTEEAEEAALAELEAKAEEAEAEAAEMEGWHNIGAVAPAALLKDKAARARVSKAVLKAAGPFAKVALLGTGPGRFFMFARQIYKEAKADAAGSKKLAPIKAAAEAGNPDAQNVMTLMKLGKKTDEEIKAASIVGAELNNQVLRSRGVPNDVVGLLPSSERVVSTIPGAKDVYALAKAGNAKAVQSIRKAGDFLRQLDAESESAQARLTELQAKAASGDPGARVELAVLAVAAAGLEESKHLKKVKAEHFRSAGETGDAKKAAALARVQRQAGVAIERTEGPLRAALARLFGTGKMAEGLSVKLARK